MTRPMGRPGPELIGQTLAGVTVEAKHGTKSQWGSAQWACRCVCGAEVMATTSRLRLYHRKGLSLQCHSHRPRKGRAQALEPLPVRSGRHCQRCHGLAHRVEGKACKGCGLGAEA